MGKLKSAENRVGTIKHGGGEGLKVNEKIYRVHQKKDGEDKKLWGGGGGAP